MYEIFATITDDLGTRTMPTGHRAFLEVVADGLATELARSYGALGHTFHVEYVPAPDAWQAA